MINYDQTSRNFTVGKNENCSLRSGEKRGWFDLVRLHADTNVEEVKQHLTQTITGLNESVEKLENKRESSSFKIGVDFTSKDERRSY